MSKKHFKKFKEIKKNEGLLEALAFDAEETSKRAAKRIDNRNKKNPLSILTRVPNEVLFYGSIFNYLPLAIKEAAKDVKYGTERTDKSKRYERLRKGPYGDYRSGFIILPFLMVLLSLFFLTPSLTGHVISKPTNTAFNILGGFLFIFGLTIALLYLSGRRASKKQDTV